ncbi:MAG: ABC transporter ATP-binding protein [Rubrivivax sp.]|nr:MAG: ABC transporter ATP-binding protein [Rubrivivax sp.]
MTLPAAGPRLLWSLLRPYRLALAATLVLLLLQSAVALALPWLGGRLAMVLLAGAAPGRLLLAVFVLVLVQAVLGYLAALRTQAVGTRMIADGCARLFDHLQSLPLGWHDDRRRGEVLALLTDDVARLGWFVTGTLTPLLPLLLLCTGALVMMLRIQPALGACIAVLVPAIFLGLRVVGRRLRPMARATVDAHAARTAFAEQSLTMLPVIKAFSGEPAASLQFHARTHRVRDLQLRQARLQSLVAPVVRVVLAAAVLLLLLLASRGIASGALAPAELVSLLLYGLMLTQPVAELASIYGQVQGARGNAERLAEAFAAAPEPTGGERTLAAARGDVRFENVVFGYPGQSPALTGLDLAIAAGETVAIIGANGAGKSTLVHLLMRFADPQAGRICLDSVDLRELGIANLRSHLGLVSQQVLLFNASIAENIAYGRADATAAQVASAAIAARAHDFVQRLPQGYDTVIGDQGVKLSGGEKQRIALARALLKDPAILILDEATAMFDPEGEAEFIAECRDLLGHRTVILITHRPASLALADRILRLDNGRLHPVEPFRVA